MGFLFFCLSYPVSGSWPCLCSCFFSVLFKHFHVYEYHDRDNGSMHALIIGVSWARKGRGGGASLEGGMGERRGGRGVRRHTLIMNIVQTKSSSAISSLSSPSSVPVATLRGSPISFPLYLASNDGPRVPI